MGKGGTKFVGEAVSHRSGRFRSSYTQKELKGMMDKYLETGVHPEVDRLERLNTGDYKLQPLPDPDAQRPYVFLDIAIGNRPAGRLVVELFEDIVPVAAAHLRHRCLSGSSVSLVNTTFHKLLQGYAIHGGRNRTVASGVSLPISNQLRHVEGNVVSVSLDGAEVVIAFERALHMDATHQVVGRIHAGQEVVRQMGALSTLPDDSPNEVVKVTKAGLTTAKGVHEELEGAAAKKLTPQEAAAKLAEESTLARSAVMMAVEEGLGQKRKADSEAGGAGPSGSSAAAAAAAGSGAGAGSSKAGGVVKRSKMMDGLLGDLSDSSSGGSSSGDEGGQGEG